MLSKIYLRHYNNPFVGFRSLNSHNAASSSPCIFLPGKKNNNLAKRNDATLLLNKKFPTTLQKNLKVAEIGVTKNGQPLTPYTKYKISRRPGVEVDRFKPNTSVRLTKHLADHGLCKALYGFFTNTTGSSCFYLPNKSNNTIKQINSSTSLVKRNISTSRQNNFKVTIIGAAGGIGQALALYLKHHSLVTHLALYDISKVTPGVAVDLSHINTCVKVTGHTGDRGLGEALSGSSLVICTAGVPRGPGMSRDDLFKTNADVIISITQSLACFSPCAFFAIVTNPINSMVPLAAEVLNRMGVYDPRKLCGVTTLDIVRAQTFIAQINNCDPTTIEVPVIGGHAEKTIIPVLSQVKPKILLKDEVDMKRLTIKIQEAGTEVVNAKTGTGSATLSTAYAISRFASSVLKALTGDTCVECAYVNSNVTDSPFFSTPVVLGKKGIEVNLGYGHLNGYEQKQLAEAVPELKRQVYKAVDYINQIDIKPPKHYTQKMESETEK